MDKKIIAIDFDGTIVQDDYPNIGSLTPNCKCVINKLFDSYYIIINTCRKGEKLTEAVNFLLDNGISFNRVNDNHPSLIAEHGNTRKIHADCFIDANNVGGMPDWSNIPDILRLKNI